MQVFRVFLKVLRKKLPFAMTYVIVFLVISFGMISNPNDSFSFEDQQYDICIFDEDQTVESQALVSYLGSRHHLISLEQEETVIRDAFYHETVDYVLTIPKGYAQKLQYGETETLLQHDYFSDSYANVLLENSIATYVSVVQSYLASGKSMEAALNATETVLSEEVPVTIGDTSKSGAAIHSYGEQFSYYFQYLPYILVSVLVQALASTIMVLQQKDLRNRTNCSCVPSRNRTFQLWMGSGIFAFGIYLIFMIAGIILNDGMYTGMAWYAVLNSFVLLLVALGIAILVSTVVSNDIILNVCNQVIGLGMSFLCGVFVPQSMLGTGVLRIAQFLPVYWYIRINNMLAGTSEEVFTHTAFFQMLGLELLFAIALFAVVFALQKMQHDGTAFIKLKKA